MEKIGILFLIIFFLSKINIFTKLFKFYNISCILVFTNLQKIKNDRKTNNLKFIKK